MKLLLAFILLAAMIASAGPVMIWCLKGMPIRRDDRLTLPRMAAGVAVFIAVFLPAYALILLGIVEGLIK